MRKKWTSIFLKTKLKLASNLKNLSSYDATTIPSGLGKKIGIVCSEWNTNITTALLQGAVDILLKHGVKEENIELIYVPGTFELPFASQQLIENSDVDGIIALGCVIQGETPHFDFICDATATGLMNVGLQTKKPCVFGVITTLNLEQALDRAGGKHGNKGVEAGVTLLKMLTFGR